MKTTISGALGAMLALYGLTGCAQPSTKSPDVTAAIRSSLDQAGLKDVTVSDDRDKGVVTLGGNVMTDGAKSQAAAVAGSLAGGQVIANQVAVLPPGDEKIAKTVGADLDTGIEKNLHAALVASRIEHVDYDVKNRVVTLKGEVNSQGMRSEAGKIAANVPYVSQVVNEVQVKDQKATSN